MVFNATFNNISVILWRLVLLVEKTTDLPQVTDKFYHIMVYWVHLVWAEFELTTLVVIGTDCIGSCRSNYHTIMTTTAALSEIIFQWNQMYEKMFEDTKDVNGRRDNTITKRQTMIYKVLDRKRLNNTTSTEIWGWKLLR